MSFSAEAPGRRITLAATVMAAALVLATAACRNTTSDEKAPAPAVAEAPAPTGPVDLQWSDADLETMAERIGYGPNPPGLLVRSPEGGLLFVPQTVRDHIATKFIKLAPHSADRSLDLILDVKTPGGQACEGWIQDQAFNTLVTVPCRTAGEQKATAKVPESVSSVRVYFQSPKREQVQLPARVRLVEHQ
jgi:hypothetical protein